MLQLALAHLRRIRSLAPRWTWPTLAVLAGLTLAFAMGQFVLLNGWVW